MSILLNNNNVTTPKSNRNYDYWEGSFKGYSPKELLALSDEELQGLFNEFVNKGLDLESLYTHYKNYKKVSVVITSASDTVGIIDANFNYFHNSPCNIYISSIRDIGPERAYLLQKFGFSKELNGVIEFPLAKMSRKNANWYTAKAWYDTTVQNMLEHILNSKPFEV